MKANSTTDPFPPLRHLFYWIVFSHLAFYGLCGVVYGLFLLFAGASGFLHVSLPLGSGSLTAGDFGPISPIHASLFATFLTPIIGFFQGVASWLITVLGLTVAGRIRRFRRHDSIHRA